MRCETCKRTVSAVMALLKNGIAHQFTLCDKLAGVKLRDDGLEDFVTDRRQHTVVIVNAVLRVDRREELLQRPVQHTQRDADGLQVC